FGRSGTWHFCISIDAELRVEYEEQERKCKARAAHYSSSADNRGGTTERVTERV
ncbi:hypothetical protein Y032_1347g3837, partial [Ancylostoma ceylanicum]